VFAVVVETPVSRAIWVSEMVASFGAIIRSFVVRYGVVRRFPFPLGLAHPSKRHAAALAYIFTLLDALTGCM
jgi:hypothetical protein